MLYEVPYLGNASRVRTGGSNHDRSHGVQSGHVCLLMSLQVYERGDSVKLRDTVGSTVVRLPYPQYTIRKGLSPTPEEEE